MESMETKHITILNKTDESDQSALNADELQKAFSFLIGLTARRVTNAEIREILTRALSQPT